MKVGIAGASGIGMGYAAILLNNGHSPMVWSPSGTRTEGLRNGAPIIMTGAIEGQFHPNTCRNAEELAENDVLILALPANGHRFVFDSLIPFIEARHTIIISGHLSFGALYLSKKLAERCIRVPIVAWSTTVMTGKAREDGVFRIDAIRAKVEMATIPTSLSDDVFRLCTALFGERFAIKDDILTIALSNLNPQNHLGIILCNLTRVERGETWGQSTNITPAVGRLFEALDDERISIARAFGKRVRTVAEHYSTSYGATGGSVAEISKMRIALGNDPLGPRDLGTRYITEDVPFGLVPTLLLAKIANVSSPLHRGGVDIVGACYGRNFEDDNDLLPELNLTDKEVIQKLAINGYPLS